MRIESKRKLWLLILVGGCLVMLQYRVMSQPGGGGGGGGGGVGGGGGGTSLLTSNVEALLQATGWNQTTLPPVLRADRHSESKREAPSTCGDASGGWPEPTLYVVTPTYRRPEQLAEMTRLAQTLMHVKNLIWLVIEDANRASPLVTNILRKSRIHFYHMTAPMPAKYKKKKVKPRGVSNRNRGLEWIRANAPKGVLYFADDDNTYDVELFEEIRSTKKVSMFPVGLCTKFGVSTPVVKNGRFAGFYDGWVGGRKFPVDMAGFAVNLEFLHKRPKASMPYTPGFEEDGFLKSLCPFEPNEIELKAANCTKILVWHTQAKKNAPATPVDRQKYQNTNILKLKEILV